MNISIPKTINININDQDGFKLEITALYKLHMIDDNIFNQERFNFIQENETEMLFKNI